MKTAFIETANFKKARALVNTLWKDFHGINLGSVRGPAGRGKTEIINRLYVHQPVPLVYVRVQSHLRTVSGLLGEISHALTGQRRIRAAASWELIRDGLRDNRRMLIVDEAERASLDQLNALRDLHDVCAVPVLLFGEESLGRKMMSEQRLHSREQLHLELQPIDAADLAMFLRSALGVELDGKAVGALHKHSKGDWRQALKDALALERLMTLNSGSEPASLIEQVCRG